MKLLLLYSLFFSSVVMAQSKINYQRLVKVVVDSTKLNIYKMALKEGTETSVLVEPGVISYTIYYEKARPNHITIFETYASLDSYTKHIATAHFKRYKDKVADIVESLEIVDVELLANVEK
jgi:quinol monooxygenase YgiN